MSTLRIYLKDIPEGLEKEAFREKGKRYVSFPSSEFAVMPDIPGELIECVTMLESEIYGTLRRQGVYAHDGAELVVKTHKSSKDGSFFQSVEISGPTPASVLKIRSLVRQGKLYPTEDYEAPQVSLKVSLRKPSIFCRLRARSLNVRDFFKDLIKRLKVRGLKVWDFFKNLKKKK